MRISMCDHIKQKEYEVRATGKGQGFEKCGESALRIKDGNVKMEDKA